MKGCTLVKGPSCVALVKRALLEEATCTHIKNCILAMGLTYVASVRRALCKDATWLFMKEFTPTRDPTCVEFVRRVLLKKATLLLTKDCMLERLCVCSICLERFSPTDSPVVHERWHPSNKH